MRHFAQWTRLARMGDRVHAEIPFVTSDGRYRAALNPKGGRGGRPGPRHRLHGPDLGVDSPALRPDAARILWCRTCDGGRESATVVAEAVCRRERLDPTAQIVIGSIRETSDVTQALWPSADIVTVPPLILDDWLYAVGSIDMAREFSCDGQEFGL